MNRTRDTAAIGRTENGDHWHFAEDTCHLVDPGSFTSHGELTYIIETSTSPLGNQQNTIDIRGYDLEDDGDVIQELDICNSCIHSKQKALFR